MKKASLKLPEIPSIKDGLFVYYLTGKKFIFQTLFCALSLYKNAGLIFQFVLVDDGSLDKSDISFLKRKMPNVILILKDEILENVKKFLPVNDFPFLNHKRKVYPHIKKLTDIHTLQISSPKLVLDSDMIFFDTPSEIIKWLKDPKGCLYMMDCQESYGYNVSLMNRICGHKVPNKMNVGVIGFNSEAINWKEIEQWGLNLERAGGTSYYLEQALCAMLAAKEDEKTILDENKYIVFPNKAQIENRVGILHHYVDLSKEHYFKKIWKQI